MRDPRLLEQDPDEMKELLSEIPLGRMGKPEEVANLALFLASANTKRRVPGAGTEPAFSGPV